MAGEFEVDERRDHRTPHRLGHVGVQPGGDSFPTHGGDDPLHPVRRAHRTLVGLEAGRGLDENLAAGQQRDELGVEVVDAGTDLGEGSGF